MPLSLWYVEFRTGGVENRNQICKYLVFGCFLIQTNLLEAMTSDWDIDKTRIVDINASRECLYLTEHGSLCGISSRIPSPQPLVTIQNLRVPIGLACRKYSRCIIWYSSRSSCIYSFESLHLAVTSWCRILARILPECIISRRIYYRDEPTLRSRFRNWVGTWSPLPPTPPFNRPFFPKHLTVPLIVWWYVAFSGLEVPKGKNGEGLS